MEKKENTGMEPVSMYTLFARLFAHVAEEVTDRFGKEGEEALKAGVWAFGEERGRNIAARAMANGGKTDIESYLPNYDMERSNDFYAENTYSENQLEQLFTKCIFAEQWTKDGTQKYGALYCEVIDAAIAKGYNKDMECIHNKHFFNDDVCTFCFKINKSE